MNIYRNRKDKDYKTYFLYKVCPPKYLGYYYESKEVITGKIRKLNNSSHKLKDFYIVAIK